MREIEMKMSQFESEEKLLGALRHLARESSRAASPDVEAGLAAAFRRHHRRRRTRNAAIVVLAVSCLVSAAVLLTRPQKVEPAIAKMTSSPAVVPVVPSVAPVLASGNTETRTTVKGSAGVGAPHRQSVQSEAQESVAFVPLPSFDPAMAKDELQIISVEMPIQDLRLVGAPVGADVPNRPVLADFVVGHDGTPYAVRLVQ